MPAAFLPTKEQSIAVSVMAACGVPQAEIVRQLASPGGRAMDLKTLRKAFRRELNEGKATANSMVARSLFKKATGDGAQSVTAAIFWLKTQAGWKEPIVISGDADNPITFANADAKTALLRGLAPPAPDGGDCAQGGKADE